VAGRRESKRIGRAVVFYIYIFPESKIRWDCWGGSRRGRCDCWPPRVQVNRIRRPLDADRRRGEGIPPRRPTVTGVVAAAGQRGKQDGETGRGVEEALSRDRLQLGRFLAAPQIFVKFRGVRTEQLSNSAVTDERQRSSEKEIKQTGAFPIASLRLRPAIVFQKRRISRRCIFSAAESPPFFTVFFRSFAARRAVQMVAGGRAEFGERTPPEIVPNPRAPRKAARERPCFQSRSCSWNSNLLSSADEWKTPPDFPGAASGGRTAIWGWFSRGVVTPRLPSTPALRAAKIDPRYRPAKFPPDAPDAPFRSAGGSVLRPFSLRLPAPFSHPVPLCGYILFPGEPDAHGVEKLRRKPANRKRAQRSPKESEPSGEAKQNTGWAFFQPQSVTLSPV